MSFLINVICLKKALQILNNFTDPKLFYCSVAAMKTKLYGSSQKPDLVSLYKDKKKETLKALVNWDPMPLFHPWAPRLIPELLQECATNKTPAEKNTQIMHVTRLLLGSILCPFSCVSIAPKIYTLACSFFQYLWRPNWKNFNGLPL